MAGHAATQPGPEVGGRAGDTSVARVPVRVFEPTDAHRVVGNSAGANLAVATRCLHAIQGARVDLQVRCTP